MSAGSDVTLRSSGGILLGAGFFAEKGSTLSAEIIDLPDVEFSGTKQLVWPGEPLTLSWSIGGHDDPDTTLPPNFGIEPSSGTAPVITLLPDIGRIFSPGGSIDVTSQETTEYTLRVDRGVETIEKTFLVTVTADAFKIDIISPSEDDQIDLAEARRGLRIAVKNDHTIASVQVFDSHGQTRTDITSLVEIDANVIFLDLTKLKDGHHSITTVITDSQGKKTIRTISLNLDKTIAGTQIVLSDTDLILQNQTILSGETKEYFTYGTLRAGPQFIMKDASSVALRASGSVDLAPGFFAETGSTLIAETVTLDPIEFNGSKSLVKSGGQSFCHGLPPENMTARKRL